MTMRRPLFWPFPLLLGLLPLGCPSEDTSPDDEAGPGLLPGDLVITEAMISPDASEEWFEIYNATGEAIELEGLELIYDNTSDSPKSHLIGRSLTIEPGDYLVVAGLLDDLAASDETDHLDYGYGNDLGDFAGTRGHLLIRDSGEVIDEMYYGAPVAGPEATKGASRSFDGAFSPDAVANDGVERWCDSTTEFAGPTFRATPGTANDLCTQGDCMENGVPRPVDTAGPGDFVITEVHANAGIVEDDVGDWFEIHALADFDLNGLELGRAITEPLGEPDQTILAADCVPVSSGDYVVFVRELDMMLNGGIPSDAMLWPTTLELTIDGSLWISTPSEGDVPGTLIDAVTWSADAGESTQLDPDFEDPTANDNLGNWCPSTLPYGAGDLGSPGAANEECAIAAPEGMCLDLDTDELRDIEPMALGDLVITEFLANPTGDDPPAEWFEVAALGAGDLNGLDIGKAGEFDNEVESEACIEVAADDYILFAHEADPLLNGGLPEVDVVFTMALGNTGSDLVLGYETEPADGVIMDPEILDQITWTSTSEGLSNSYGGLLDTVSNDDLMAWCDGEPSSPAEANPSCGGGPTGECIDPDTNQLRPLVLPVLGDIRLTEVMPDPDANGQVTDALGEWFEIHTTAAFDLNGLEIGKDGVVAFTVEDPMGMCIEVDVDTWVAFAEESGDPMNCLDGVTTLDYDGMSLTNDPGNMFVGYGGVVFDEFMWMTSAPGVSLSLDLMSDMWCDGVDPYGCGDLGTPGAANPACGGGMMDGMCFDAGLNADRPSVAPQLGDLVITEFLANPDGGGNVVPDNVGEWFEVRALADVDLNGLELGNAAFMQGTPADVTLADNDCLSVVAGETVLFARNSDNMVNGGLPPVDFVVNVGLTNSNAFLYIGHGGALLDQVGWAASATGASTSLDPDFYDPALNDMANNADPAWCYEATPYGLGDKGTPDADNGQCP